MFRKIAVAVIATTMLVAPALAADAVKTTPAATAVTKIDAAGTPTMKTVRADKDVKTAKVAVRMHRHHWTVASHSRHNGHVMTAKISKPVKHAKVIKTDKPASNAVKTSKVPASKPASQS